MTSTERAPEPTMEEILASIRRIISDDESSSARKPTASASHQDDEGLEAVEGEADDQIINDIARVLSAGAPPAEAEEDILDLTAELGGLEPVDAEMILVEAVVEEFPVEDLTPLEVLQADDLQADDLQAAPAMPQPQAAAPAPQPQPQAKAPEPVAPPPPLSASDEAASALERAIAALRAGQLPTSFAEFSTAPVAQPEPQAFVPEPQAFVPEPQAFVPEPEPELEPEPDLVLTEFEVEMIAEETVAFEALEIEPDQAPAWETEAPSFTAAVEREPELEAPRVNGSGAHQSCAPSPSPLDASPRTLEDSVKDMLRPMLRQWLDENMARVLTAALKDELKDDPSRRQGD